MAATPFTARRTPRVATALLCALALAALSPRARADVAPLVSVRDNTLYESPTGTLSNGAGSGMFAGRTSQLSNSRRRALVRFDVAGGIPSGSIVLSATLQLFCTTSASNGGTSTAVHRALADWGEGTSDAGFPGGAGTAATVGDATWTDRFYPAQPWAAAGGDFDPLAQAALAVTPVGPVTIASTPALVAQVQSWLDAPATNFGWLLLGDESAPSTANRFATREAGGTGVPTLVIEYTPPATPAQAATWGRLKGLYR